VQGFFGCLGAHPRLAHGCCHLPLRNLPISPKEHLILFGRDDLKAVLFIKVNRPQRLPKSQSKPARATGLGGATGDAYRLLDILKTHDAAKGAILLESPKEHSIVHLLLQLISRHIRVRPAIRQDNASVGQGTIIDNRPDRLKIALVTNADHVPASYVSFKHGRFGAAPTAHSGPNASLVDLECVARIRACRLGIPRALGQLDEKRRTLAFGWAGAVGAQSAG
jgi:hypothetical protein